MLYHSSYFFVSLATGNPYMAEAKNGQDTYIFYLNVCGRPALDSVVMTKVTYLPAKPKTRVMWRRLLGDSRTKLLGSP